MFYGIEANSVAINVSKTSRISGGFMFSHRKKSQITEQAGQNFIDYILCPFIFIETPTLVTLL
jgi:hypothetical protein